MVATPRTSPPDGDERASCLIPSPVDETGLKSRMGLRKIQCEREMKLTAHLVVLLRVLAHRVVETTRVEPSTWLVGHRP